MFDQKDFALQAVKRGRNVVALKSDNDACIAVHLDTSSSMLEHNELERLFKVDEHVGVYARD